MVTDAAAALGVDDAMFVVLPVAALLFATDGGMFAAGAFAAPDAAGADACVVDAVLGGAGGVLAEGVAFAGWVAGAVDALGAPGADGAGELAPAAAAVEASEAGAEPVVGCAAGAGSAGLDVSRRASRASRPRPSRDGFSGGAIISLKKKTSSTHQNIITSLCRFSAFGVPLDDFFRDGHVGLCADGCDIVNNDRLAE